MLPSSQVSTKVRMQVLQQPCCLTHHDRPGLWLLAAPTSGVMRCVLPKPSNATSAFDALQQRLARAGVSLRSRTHGERAAKCSSIIQIIVGVTQCGMNTDIQVTLCYASAPPSLTSTFSETPRTLTLRPFGGCTTGQKQHRDRLTRLTQLCEASDVSGKIVN